MNKPELKTMPHKGVLTPDFAEVKRNPITGERSLMALKSFKPGETTTHFTWEQVHTNPMIFTVQIAENKHIDLLPFELQCMNHNCNPNCFFDTENKELKCLTAIISGDEITFFYPSSEWEMSNVFECSCGSKNCMKTIRGAKFLSLEQRAEYKFTEFILSKFQEK